MRKKEISGSGKSKKVIEPLAKSVKGKPLKEKPVKEKPANEKPAKQKSVKGNSATKVKPTKEKSTKERLIPGKIAPGKLADYLEIMTIAAFQAGVSWAMIQNKWNNFRTAFANFDPVVVAKFKQSDIDRLMQDPGIMRSEKKIRGTIENARTMLEMQAEHGNFQNYLRSFSSYGELSADIQKRFKHIGAMSVYYFLFRVGENVPPFDPWILTIEGEHPRMREMVEKAESDSGSAS
jgi:Methyladenine glycosylase